MATIAPSDKNLTLAQLEAMGYRFSCYQAPVVLKYRNGGIYRNFRTDNFSADQVLTLKAFAVLFNEGFHAGEIGKMVMEFHRPGRHSDATIQQMAKPENLVRRFTYAQFKLAIYSKLSERFGYVQERLDGIFQAKAA